MGKLKAKNGRTRPYNVKYWEIGNEIYGDWQIGHCSAEEFGERYLEFSSAMKKVDPEIVVFACGDIDKEWNQKLR